MQLWEGAIKDFLVVSILLNSVAENYQKKLPENFCCNQYKDNMTPAMINIFPLKEYIATQRWVLLGIHDVQTEMRTCSAQRCHQKARIDQYKNKGIWLIPEW